MPNAPQAIADLVERFRHNLDHYHSPGYNETQARVEFIDPLFVALGWDVHNWSGAAPKYRDWTSIPAGTVASAVQANKGRNRNGWEG